MLVAPLWVAARAATGESACAPETRAVLAAPTPRYLRKLRRVERGRASDSPSVFVLNGFVIAWSCSFCDCIPLPAGRGDTLVLRSSLALSFSYEKPTGRTRLHCL